MAINTVAIQETIDALRDRIAKDTAAVDALERILGHTVDEPRPAKIGRAVVARAREHTAAAKADPPKRRGGRRKKVEDEKPARRAKPMPNVDAEDDGQAKVYRLVCVKCDAKYVGKRRNAACPSCNPRTVTAREHYAS